MRLQPRKNCLSEKACNNESAKREFNEKRDSLRLPFQVDRGRIIRSRAFRRLKHKTQFMVAPRSDVYRTRLTHTIEAEQIARTIAEFLGLNVDLASAIAMAHDLGHPPFGHQGESALADRLRGHKKKFDHHQQSIRIVKGQSFYPESVSSKFTGLNLTKQTLYGLSVSITAPNRNHRLFTQEALVAHYAEDIAHLNHDFEDLLHAGMLGKIPARLSTRLRNLGSNHEARINSFIIDLLNATHKSNRVTISEEMLNFISELRQSIKKDILSYPLLSLKDREARDIVKKLFDFYYKEENTPILENYLTKYGRNPYVSDAMLKGLAGGDRLTIVTDHVAAMTDRFALEVYQEFISPAITQHYL